MIRALACAAVAFGAGMAPLAQCELQKLVPATGGSGDQTGITLDADAGTIVLGAPLTGPNSGAAHVFEALPGAYVQTATLLSLDAATGDWFGSAVAVSGDRIVVGAHLDDDLGDQSGAVYVFERVGTTWSETAKLVAADGAANAQFGRAVAVDGDRVLVGAPGDDDLGTESGSAYVFDLVGSTWTQSAKLLAGDGAAQDEFATAVALAGERALLGAALDDDAGPESGSAYLFEVVGSTWTQSAKLVAADGETLDHFGISVAASGDTVLVGAFGDDDLASKSGAAYVFDLVGSAWTQTAKLVAADGEEGDHVGLAVALDGDTAVAGAVYEDDLAPNSGAVYAFERAGSVWTQAARFKASDAATQDRIGRAVAVSGDLVVGGAYLDDDWGPDSGAAYAFSLAGSGCPTLGVGTWTVSTSAGGAQDFRIAAGPMLASRPYVLAGSASGVAPGIALGSTTVPLNVDVYLLATVRSPGTPPLLGGAGVLDATGAASARFVLPAASDPALVGLLVHHAFVAYDASTGVVLHASNAAPLRLVP